MRGLKLRGEVIRLSLCNMILLWNREWIMRGETGDREAITRLLWAKAQQERKVAWVKAVEREGDAFQKYLEGRNNRA